MHVWQDARAHARAVLLGLPAVIVVGLAIAAAPAGASYIGCGGSAKGTDKSDPTQLTYHFRCDEEIKGYTIVASRAIASFSTEVNVVDSTGATLSKESFGCEGSIPASGFSCNGDMTPGHAATGGLSTESDPCAQPKRPLRLWLVVIAAEKQADGSTAMRPSQPFGLATPKCHKTPTSTKKRRRAKH